MNFGDGRQPINIKALEMLMEIINNFFSNHLCKESFKFSLPRYFRKIQKQTNQPHFFKIPIGNLARMSCDGNKSSWWWRS
jgi:hypothetical protein